MISTLAAFLFMLLLVVGVHEAGHALVARCFNVKIEHIAIGFGRPLFRWTSKSGIQWIWALWPLGGSVRLLNTRIAKVPQDLQKYCFDKQPVGAKTLILLAGVGANLLLAWLALLLVFLIGINLRPPLIEQVQANSLAGQSGFQSGDLIESIDDKPIYSWQEFGQQIIMGMGSASLSVKLTSAQGTKKTLRLKLKNWHIKPSDRSLLTSLGIQADSKVKLKRRVADSFVDAVISASMTVFELIRYLMITLKQVLTGVMPFSLLLGPVGILEQAAWSLAQGISVFAMFIAGLSLAVAIVNILPVPGLDGASIVYAWLEKIRGKPISIALEVLLYQLAVIFFGILLVNLLLNDALRYVGAVAKG